MRDETGPGLPVVESFGERFEAAIARREGSRPLRRRAAVAVFAAALLAVGLLTPAGGAATDWVGEQLGIGEPGGPPSVSDEPRDRGSRHQRPFDTIVLATGRAPDGPRYEYVLERFDELEDQSGYGPYRYCLNIEWPEATFNIDPHYGCFEEFPKDTWGAGPKAGSLVKAISYYQRGDVPNVPQLRGLSNHVEITGVTHPDARRVEVRFETTGGERRAAPVELRQITPGRFGAEIVARPFGLFTAFVPPAFRYFPIYDSKQCPPGEGRGGWDPEAIEVAAYDSAGRRLATEIMGNNVSTFMPVACIERDVDGP